MFESLWTFLFPPKCVICKSVLDPQQTDLCHHCRQNLTGPNSEKIKLSFLAGWTAVWYYEGDVRASVLRFKFYNRRSYALSYGKLLAMTLLEKYPNGFDMLTWVPVSKLRRWKRGYDQCQLLANSVGEALGMQPVKALKKLRNNPPQSGITGFSARKANVLGAYACPCPEQVKGKRILLLDDIITTGATASECARVLLTAGAKEVYCGAIAAAPHNQKK